MTLFDGFYKIGNFQTQNLKTLTLVDSIKKLHQKLMVYETVVKVIEE